MKALLTDILDGMTSAAAGIQDQAIDLGYLGKRTDAPAVINYLANTSLDLVTYAVLYANSQTLIDGMRLIERHGTPANKRLAAKLTSFAYWT